MAGPDLKPYNPNPVISLWRQHDDLSQFAQIMREHDAGFFTNSALFLDEIFTDDRIQGVTETRTGELLSSELKVDPATDNAKAKKIAEELGGTDGYSGTWDTMCSAETIAMLETWGMYLGVAVAEIAWQRTADAWTPRLVPWHPSMLRWDDYQRVFILQTREGQVVLPRPDENPHGDGRWFVWCPYGVHYGWRQGLIRSVGEIYLARRWAKVSFSRWAETRSLGVVKGKTPPGGNPEQMDSFRRDLGNMGSDGVVICPQGSDGSPGYDIEGVEFGGTGQSWQGIKSLIDDCNTDISILVLGGNLTTEVKEGALASTKEHKKTEVNRAVRDAKIAGRVREQMLWHWAELNYGDPELAPRPCYEVLPPEDEVNEGNALKALGDGIAALQLASPRVDAEAILEGAGIPLITEAELAAKQADEAEAAAAQAALLQPQQDDGGAGAGGGGAGGAQPGADPKAGKQQPPKDKKTVAARAALGGALENVVRRYQFQGLNIAVENPGGTLRRWTDAGGKLGHTLMKHDYGFVEGYMGADKEELDVYVGPYEDAPDVYVVHQRGVGASGRWAYDEDKCFMGFASAEDAKAAFLAHRDDGDRAYGGMLVLPLERFKAKLRRRGGDSTSQIRASADITNALVALSGRASATKVRTVAGRQRAAKYQQTLIQNSIRRAAETLAPFLSGMKAEIDKASSYEQLRKSIVRHLRVSNPKGLATVIQKANILSNLSGQAAATDEV